MQCVHVRMHIKQCTPQINDDITMYHKNDNNDDKMNKKGAHRGLQVFFPQMLILWNMQKNYIHASLD